ncbi:MAG: hypothetical protein ACFE9L_00085 [Candidatus Hodarchaeota archaeon]
MSFTFAYLGPLTNEIDVVLSNLDENLNWEFAEEALYNSGLVFSEKSNERIIAEIKQRFKSNNEFLPSLNSVIALSKSNMNSRSKVEIYYVYLYNIDPLVSTMVEYLGEIYENSSSNLVITRKDVKNLLLRYLERNKKKITSKSVENWIGRFLSLLKEINILIPQARSSFIMNLGGISLETWTFFVLDAYFENYNPLESYFINAFQIKEDHIANLISWSNTKKWVNCKLQVTDNKAKYMEINTNYNCLGNWLNDL